MLSFTDLAVTLDDADAYAESRGRASWIDAPSSPPDGKMAALRRGQDYIAGRYNRRWIVAFDNDDAPDQVKFAICEAGIIELANPGSLAPLISMAGGAVKRKRVKAGPVESETEYVEGTATLDRITAIENLLAGLIRSGATVELLRA